ncbi:GNAT family N-acetyltransferase [Acetobacter sp.]|uniref:GNAT family N-acetyltransferase n=1 Tax=Acetobacter sp. TaxID=440 RepID=UPI0039ECC69D
MLRTISTGENDPRLPAFLKDRLGVTFFPPFTVMGLEKDGQIIAAMLFNVYTGPDIHVTIAGSGWTRRLLREMGQYLFDILQVERFTAVTEKQNVIDFVERVGGKREGVLRNHFGRDRDGVIIGVLADEYRYRKHGEFAQGPRPIRNG